MLDRTALLSVSFDGSIVTISTDRSTRFHLDVSATSGLLQYQCVLQCCLCVCSRKLKRILSSRIFFLNLCTQEHKMWTSTVQESHGSSLTIQYQHILMHIMQTHHQHSNSVDIQCIYQTSTCVIPWPLIRWAYHSLLIFCRHFRA